MGKRQDCAGRPHGSADVALRIQLTGAFFRQTGEPRQLGSDSPRWTTSSDTSTMRYPLVAERHAPAELVNKNETAGS
jgi:hypothetical protein